jgi:hypothetical protein
MGGKNNPDPAQNRHFCYFNLSGQTRLILLKNSGGKMDLLPRREPPRTGSEKELLESFLDFHRATFMIKAQGLSEAAIRQSMAPSALTIARLLKHIAGAELFWFQFLFAGLDIDIFRERLDGSVGE